MLYPFNLLLFLCCILDLSDFRRHLEPVKISCLLIVYGSLHKREAVDMLKIYYVFVRILNKELKVCVLPFGYLFLNNHTFLIFSDRTFCFMDESVVLEQRRAAVVVNLYCDWWFYIWVHSGPPRGPISGMRWELDHLYDTQTWNHGINMSHTLISMG